MSNEHVHPAFAGAMRQAQNGIHRSAYDTHPAARKLESILRAYELACRDPQAKIPTALMMTIEAAKL